MKQVFDSNEVAHIWATQSQDAGRNSNNNFYFKGETIFSYGSHFPIATIFGNDVLFTLSKYSNTTAKQVAKARQAISHKNIIYCYEVPVNYTKETPIKELSFIGTHEKNIEIWKSEIKALFDELGNKRIRDTQGRINAINEHINKLQTYCNYFKVKIEDKGLKDLLKLAQSDNFVDAAIKAKDKVNEARIKKMQLAGKAYSKYISLWRDYKNDEIKELPEKTKELCNYYQNDINSYTRLRLNKDENRLETSKGVQIPVAIAKKAFIALNGCMEGSCNDLSIPVLSYVITKTDKDTITAGCHTIPKEDIKYIAQLLQW